MDRRLPFMLQRPRAAPYAADSSSWVDDAQGAEGGALTCDGLNDTFSSSVLLFDGGGMILNGVVLNGGAEGAEGVMALFALDASGGGSKDTADGFNFSCVAASGAAPMAPAHVIRK